MKPISPAALVVAHPGHELRVHGWLERVRPIVFVLTDGSGHGPSGRVASTARVIDDAGARAGAIFGRFADRALYEALLARDGAFFVALAEELADALALAGVATVAGDALEGFNPGHDVCRLVIDAVVARSIRRGAPLASYSFPLEGAPDMGSESAGALAIDLDDDALDRKLTVAQAYPEMAAEVERARARWGLAAFRRERLSPATPRFDLAALYPTPPFFEVHGERRVAEGVYTEVVRWRDHLRPIAEALERFAGSA